MIDTLVLGLVNMAVYLRHPYQVARFRHLVGYFPNVACARKYNEKMLWRKVFDRNPVFVTFCDKLATKALQAKHCRNLEVLPALWVGEDCTSIPDDLFRQAIVIKANHGSGWNHFAQEGTSTAQLPVRRINGWLARTFGQGMLEWPYASAAKKLFCEAMLVSTPGEPLIDLSVHAGNGLPFFVEVVIANKTSDQLKGYYRPDGTRWLEIEKQPAADSEVQSLPADFKLPRACTDALAHAATLSRDVDYARFDFMIAEGRLYGGEITVYPGSGLTDHVQFQAYNGVLTRKWDILGSYFFKHPGGRLRAIYANALRRRLIKDGHDS